MQTKLGNFTLIMSAITLHPPHWIDTTAFAAASRRRALLAEPKGDPIQLLTQVHAPADQLAAVGSRLATSVSDGSLKQQLRSIGLALVDGSGMVELLSRLPGWCVLVCTMGHPAGSTTYCLLTPPPPNPHPVQSGPKHRPQAHPLLLRKARRFPPPLRPRPRLLFHSEPSLAASLAESVRDALSFAPSTAPAWCVLTLQHCVWRARCTRTHLRGHGGGGEGCAPAVELSSPDLLRSGPPPLPAAVLAALAFFALRPRKGWLRRKQAPDLDEAAVPHAYQGAPTRPPLSLDVDTMLHGAPSRPVPAPGSRQLDSDAPLLAPAQTSSRQSGK